MQVWLKGLLAAMLAGAASAVAAMMIDYEHFNLEHLKHLGIVAAVGAIMGVAGYLKQSPIPPSA